MEITKESLAGLVTSGAFLRNENPPIDYDLKKFLQSCELGKELPCCPKIFLNHPANVFEKSNFIRNYQLVFLPIAKSLDVGDYLNDIEILGEEGMVRESAERLKEFYVRMFKLSHEKLVESSMPLNLISQNIFVDKRKIFYRTIINLN